MDPGLVVVVDTLLEDDGCSIGPALWTTLGSALGANAEVVLGDGPDLVVPILHNGGVGRARRGCCCCCEGVGRSDQRGKKDCSEHY